MKHLKLFENWSVDRKKFPDESISLEEDIQLIAMANDPSMDEEEWIIEFDQWYNSPLQMTLLRKQKIQLKKEYASGEYEWTFRGYEGVDTGEELAELSKKDKADFERLKNRGWEVWAEDVDGETPKDAWFYYLLSKKGDPKRFSQEAKKYITTHNPSSKVVQGLSNLLTPQDLQEIRGTVHGSRYGV